MRSDEELKRIADGMMHGTVYHSQILPKGVNPPMVFRSLATMPKADQKAFMAAWKSGEIRLVFEWLEKSVTKKGLPSFLSHQTLSKAEIERLNELMGRPISDFMKPKGEAPS